MFYNSENNQSFPQVPLADHLALAFTINLGRTHVVGKMQAGPTGIIKRA